MAQYLWKLGDSTIGRIFEYLPTISVADSPSACDVESFIRVWPDSQNHGVLNDDGSRRPPPYLHWVDDNCYADVRRYLLLGIASSMLAVYLVLGFPDSRQPDVFSRDKLETFYSHRRKICGTMIDTRRMEVSLPDYKRQQLVELLATWIAPSRTHFRLLDAAALHGSLQSATQVCRWGRCRFFLLQNMIRSALRSEYSRLKHIYKRKRGVSWQSRIVPLPAHIERKISHLTSRETARLIWHSRRQISLSAALRAELSLLHDYLSDFSNPWSKSIGHLVPRDPNAIFYGDASELAGGFFSHELSVFCSILWSPGLRARLALSPSHPDFLHINHMEFLIIIIQFAATIALLDDDVLDFPELRRSFPPIPMVRFRSDNTSAESWTNSMSSKSLVGQNLVRLFGALAARTCIGYEAAHIPGDLNTLADLLSRPPASLTPSLSHTFMPQLYQQEPSLRLYSFFHPSSEMLSLLQSVLSSNVCIQQPVLPKTLGHMVPASSTSISFSCL